MFALVVDVEIARRTFVEGTSYARAAWERAPGLVLLWACLWMSWQLALIPPLWRRAETGAARGGAGS